MSQSASDLGSILIVEDNRGFRESLADVINHCGYEVDCAANGQEALNHLRRGRLPALILLDWSMQIMDGKEFLRHQQADPRLAPIPVVVVSGTADQLALSSLGLAGYVKKPIDLDELLNPICQYCGVSSVVRLP